MKQRILLMLGRAFVRLVDDDTGLQKVQVDALAGETLDGLERWQDYGMTSVPHPEAEVILVALGGMRQDALAIRVDDRRYRVKGLATGEVCLYTDEDENGHRVHLKRDRTIEMISGETSIVMTPTGVTINAASVTLNCASDTLVFQ